MSTPVSGTINWTTPVTINSGDIVTATDLNALNKDVAFLRAKPWITYYASSGSATMGASYGSGNPYGGVSMLGASGITSAILNSSSGVGSFNASSGGITLPSGLAGLYRVTAQMMVSAVSTAHVRILAQLFAGSTVVGYVPGIWNVCGTDHNATPTLSFVFPGNVASSVYGGTITGIAFLGQTTGSSTPAITATDLAGKNPTSAQPTINTFATVEYLGTSTGAY
jgi:hypothetical protein